LCARQKRKARRPTQREVYRVWEFMIRRIVVFNLNKFIAIVSFSRWLTLRLLRSERGKKIPRRTLTRPRIQLI
jgi:hypothetical protein